MNLFRSKKDLYQFTHGTKIWYFTSAAKDLTHDEVIYKSVPGLSRGNIEDADIDKCETEINFPSLYPLLNNDNDDMAAVFLNKIYYESVYVTILELYKDETLVIFKGRVTQPKYDESNHTMSLVCSTNESYQRRNILTRKFQRSCANKIYDRFCGLNIEDWWIEATITNISDLSISYTTATPVENGYFDRGLLIKDGIFTYLPNATTLYRPHIGLQVGDVVHLAPGCDQSLKLCDERFNNHLRFHGFPNMPQTNPVMDLVVK